MMAGAPAGWPVGAPGQIKWCPFKLLFFHYLFILYLLEDEVKGGREDLFSFKKNCTPLYVQNKGFTT